MTPQFGKHTTGDEIVQNFPDAVRGKTFVITGPSPGGIGAETALSLSRGHPHQVVLVGRSRAKVEPLMTDMRQISQSMTITFIQADLGSLTAVREAAQEIKSQVQRIDCLVNNAAVMACPYTRSADGYELQFATNHLGHFVLVNELMGSIANGGRVVIVSSLGHRFSDIRWDDPNFEVAGTYDSGKAYGQSKTANILHAKKLAQIVKDRDIGVFSVHPGSITSNLQRYITSEDRQVMIAEMLKMYPDFEMPEQKSLQAGCATQLRAALDSTLADRSGSYLSDCQVAETAPWGADMAAADRLWALSETLTAKTET